MPEPEILIGVDPHKSTHTVAAVDPLTNQQVASLRIDAMLVDYKRVLKWAAQWPERKWAIENAKGLGRHFASLLACLLLSSPEVTPGGGGVPTLVRVASCGSVFGRHHKGRSMLPLRLKATSNQGPSMFLMARSEEIGNPVS